MHMGAFLRKSLAFIRLLKGLGLWPKKRWWTAPVNFYSKYIKGGNFFNNKNHHLKTNPHLKDTYMKIKDI